MICQGTSPRQPCGMGRQQGVWWLQLNVFLVNQSNQCNELNQLNSFLSQLSKPSQPSKLFMEPIQPIKPIQRMKPIEQIPGTRVQLNVFSSPNFATMEQRPPRPNFATMEQRPPRPPETPLDPFQPCAVFEIINQGASPSPTCRLPGLMGKGFSAGSS